MSQPDWFFDATHRLRTVWRFVIFGAGFVGAQMITSVLVLIGWIAYLWATGSMPRNGDPTQLLAQVEGDWMVPLQIAAAVPYTVLITVWTLFCRRQIDRRSIRSMGLSRPSGRPTESVFGGLLFGLLPLSAAALSVLALNGFEFKGTSASAQTAWLVPTLLLMAFAEEIVCRGYLMQNLVDLGRPAWGVIVSAILFWLAHAFNPAAWSPPLVPLNMIGAGVTLALAYRVAGNIWFPTAMHFGWNFAQGVVFEIPVSGIRTDGLIDFVVIESAPSWLTGGAFGLEASVMVTLVEAGLTATFLVLLRGRAAESPDVLPSSVFIEG
jgi:membrane protease YdiL (CAAX protease family)